jgi:hypothetical protein
MFIYFSNLNKVLVTCLNFTNTTLGVWIRAGPGCLQSPYMAKTALCFPAERGQNLRSAG